MEKGTWDFREIRGSPIGLLDTFQPLSPYAHLCIPFSSAVVIGSTQDLATLDAESGYLKAFEVVRRHSGGGAVAVIPGELVWVNIGIPKGNELWCEDVASSSLWLGRVWENVLKEFGITQSQVVATGPSNPSMGRIACFGSTSPGEVHVGDKKIVGISQRRTREGSVFQSAMLLVWRPELLIDLLAPCLTSGADIRNELTSHAIGLSELIGNDSGIVPLPQAGVVDERIGHLGLTNLVWESLKGALIALS